MKRIERNTYNALRKSVTAETINVEIPVDYTHEGRQGIHEMLTIEKGLYVTGINWNSIQGCYCIHYERAYGETAEGIRSRQEAADIDSITEGMVWSDYTWNGYKKPCTETETTEEETETETAAPSAPSANEETAAEKQTTDTEEEEEEETMLNTFTPAEAAMHAATVRGIIRRKGGYRERDILNHPHTVERGETWNEAHKVVEIIATTPEPDGYRPGCAVDIVTRSIVG